MKKFLKTTAMIAASHMFLTVAMADTITIKAAGQLAGGIGPIMVVSVAGQKIASVEVRNTAVADFTFTTGALVPGSRLDIAFTNDAGINGQDRNLFIQSVTVNGVNLPRAAAVYDLGNGAAATDHINTRSADLNGGLLPWNGAWRFRLSAGLSEHQIAVIINENDPSSVALGQYYQQRRLIPASQIIRVRLPVTPAISRTDFAVAKQKIDAAMNPQIQALVVAWTYPFRVECNSMTSAITLGFQDVCASTCTRGKANPYFNSNMTLPFSQSGIRPSMMLAARNLTEAKALVDRGIAAYRSNPVGSGYLMQTTDLVRSIRTRMYDHLYLNKWISPAVDVKIVDANSIQQPDIMFYFQGLANLTDLGGSNIYRPGAIADNFTSYGGVLDTGYGQTSILNFIAAGATGSFGTVSEPCADNLKFPDPKIVTSRYTRGASLIEAYWKSVQYPFQGLFIGDPLATPWTSLPKNPDTIAPRAPAMVGVSWNATTKSAVITWQKSSDNVGTKGYRIIRNGHMDVGTVAATGNTGTASFVDDDPQLKYGTSFYYEVIAIDGSFNASPKSNSMTVQIAN